MSVAIASAVNARALFNDKIRRGFVVLPGIFDRSRSPRETSSASIRGISMFCSPAELFRVHVDKIDAAPFSRLMSMPFDAPAVYPCKIVLRIEQNAAQLFSVRKLDNTVGFVRSHGSLIYAACQEATVTTSTSPVTKLAASTRKHGGPRELLDIAESTHRRAHQKFLSASRFIEQI